MSCSTDAILLSLSLYAVKVQPKRKNKGKSCKFLHERKHKKKFKLLVDVVARRWRAVTALSHNGLLMSFW
ncbi:hypothetical protein MRB53_027999 [Persea americana]|uniref:Uncharacterized protein n=1 Tax=Persea americana TaxID=3435 RepID=A0ACC2KE90_PERAE|nr:hypothetical protein MRB53_027999 [Persea americana]